MVKNVFVALIMLMLFFCSYKDGEQTATGAEGGKKMEIKITSPAFEEGGMIPSRYTCDGEDISPPL
ncbi:MAG: hypothetical protein ACYSQZ_06075, partial [Planctomycetota bacterium]